MWNKSRLLLQRNKYYTRIEVCYRDDEQISIANTYILSVLNTAAEGRNVFIEYLGYNTELEDANNVIEKSIDAKNIYRRTLWIRGSWLSITDQSFVEEPYVTIYIYDNTYSWNTFLERGKKRFDDKLKIEQFQIAAYFEDIGGPVLYIKRGDTLEEEVINSFKQEGYVVKKVFPSL